ncbi:MAG TPA: NADH-quinone oxidoreductase subunit J [Chitinophagaceae bacterium]|nr:NADH-quinone oxidoreductase subunit J [Chitinophagaceae bacterium]
MTMQETIFWILSFIVLFCAVGVITSRKPVNSVLFLIMTFFGIAGHYLLLNAQFLAIVHIIVYAGAIMVLFLFVIMLMNLNEDAEVPKSQLVKFAGVISGGILLLVVLAALKKADIALISPGSTDIGLIGNLGRTLFHQFIVPFEVSSVLFLSAMVGAVVIGKKN